MDIWGIIQVKDMKESVEWIKLNMHSSWKNEYSFSFLNI